MKAEIKCFASSIGFDAVGVARPAPTTWERYRDWVSRGYHGEMGYLETRSLARRDLSRFANPPGSVIVFAKQYFPLEYSPVDRDGPFDGFVSQYAWGDDYHDIVADGLKKICEFIHQRTDGRERARWLVDTAPILERDFAAQAGIGWFGKHTHILSRTLGNWFFLGEIVTTLQLEPDAPVSSRCGTCTRCLDVCPTGAFAAPYVLDARRCISYLTIEHKGPIPRELRPKLGRRIYGCDECLSVCPWNRFTTPIKDTRLQPRQEWMTLDLIELMGLTDDEFRQRFKGSPIKRIKRRGLLRNAAVALGNTKDPRAVSALIKSLGDGEPLIRSHAAWALGAIRGEEARRALRRALVDETDPMVLREVEYALKID